MAHITITTSNIDTGIRFLEWIEEDVSTKSGEVIAAILQVAPALREKAPEELVHLINVFSSEFTESTWEYIQENDNEDPDL